MAIESDEHPWQSLDVDLNMVRAGVADHPCQWKWSGYHGVQKPKARYRLIVRDRLRTFLNSDSNIALAQTDRGWIESQLKSVPVRQEHFGKSIGLVREGFIRGVQHALSSRAIGRYVLEAPASGYQSKEPTAECRCTSSDQTELKNLAMPVTNPIPWKWENTLGW
jgi:putative transposase